MSEKKVICWDLDGTLGTFESVLYDMKKKGVDELVRPVSLRPGIRLEKENERNSTF